MCCSCDPPPKNVRSIARPAITPNPVDATLAMNPPIADGAAAGAAAGADALCFAGGFAGGFAGADARRGAGDAARDDIEREGVRGADRRPPDGRDDLLPILCVFRW